MIPRERLWLGVVLAGGLAVGGLTVVPAMWPRPQVPTVTQVALPPSSGLAVAQAPGSAEGGKAGAEPPNYPTTGSVTPLISGRLNLNTATLEQLDALPKVGPALAKRIVEGRPYKSLADFDAVKGIGPSTLKTLAPLVTF